MSDEPDWDAIVEEPDEWGEPVKPSKPKRRLDVVVSVRFSADEERQIRQHLNGEPLSGWVRHMALAAAQPSMNIRLDKTPNVFITPFGVWAR